MEKIRLRTPLMCVPKLPVDPGHCWN